MNISHFFSNRHTYNMFYNIIIFIYVVVSCEHEWSRSSSGGSKSIAIILIDVIIRSVNPALRIDR